jgi:hypothetical protein
MAPAFATAVYQLALYSPLPLAYIAIKLFSWGRRKPDLPPGPPTTLIVGNMLQMPKEFLQIQYVLNVITSTAIGCLLNRA